MTNSGKFTNWKTAVVRLNHPVLQAELHDMAKDMNVPVQWVFDKVMERVFEDYDVDALLIKVIADLDGYNDTENIQF